MCSGVFCWPIYLVLPPSKDSSKHVPKQYSKQPVVKQLEITDGKGTKAACALDGVQGRRMWLLESAEGLKTQTIIQIPGLEGLEKNTTQKDPNKTA